MTKMSFHIENDYSYSKPDGPTRCEVVSYMYWLLPTSVYPRVYIRNTLSAAGFIFRICRGKILVKMSVN